jgi:hypothetical protein
MTLSEISTIRLFSQKIKATKFTTAKDIVSWMGAMQAQDFTMAKWAVGLRLQNSTEKKIEAAINKGEIIRTHLMRPTWHFVSADDIYWMLELTAPRIISSLKSRHIELELTKDNITKSNRIIEKSLSDGVHLNRDEIRIILNKANIKTDENRLSHLMLRAELDGLICSGHIINSKQTYGLLRERVPFKKSFTKEESLAEIAKRYFTSHCPATMKDFIWWSGLLVSEARTALELVKSLFFHETINSEKYWFTDSFSKIKNQKTSIHFLPAYDEFLISYRDRSASLRLINNEKVISDNGIFRPVIIVNGQVSGLWKRVAKNDKIFIETDIINLSNELSKDTIKTAAEKVGNFYK